MWIQARISTKNSFISSKKKICINKIKKNVFAFCGIGFPKNFFNSLKEKGLNIVDSKVFGDHHIYKDNELEEILKIARLKNLDIITTQKDYLRIDKSYKKLIKYTKIEINISKKKKFLSFVLQKITWEIFLDRQEFHQDIFPSVNEVL